MPIEQYNEHEMHKLPVGHQQPCIYLQQFQPETENDKAKIVFFLFFFFYLGNKMRNINKLKSDEMLSAYGHSFRT